MDYAWSFTRTLRWLVGGAIVTAGLAIALVRTYHFAAATPLQPAIMLIAMMGVGLTVFATRFASLFHDSAPCERGDRTVKAPIFKRSPSIGE